MIYVDTNVLISYINIKDPLHEKAVKVISENRNLVTSIITQVELYSVFSRTMEISDLELEALVEYTFEKTGTILRDLSLEEVFSNAVIYANRLKLRTLDLLHVVAAYVLGCKSFFTFDKNILSRAKIIEDSLGLRIAPS